MSARREPILWAGILAFAVYHAALALVMAISPHSFFSSFGHFGLRNDHYIRDVASYNGAIACALVIAARKHSWRGPLLGLLTIQFALHSLNHLADIDAASPASIGPLDFGLLAAATLALAALWRLASVTHLERQTPAALHTTLDQRGALR